MNEVSVLFSEPKIPQCRLLTTYSRRGRKFQCSSASRKFLNMIRQRACGEYSIRFSALQRAENSSMARSPPRPSSFSRVSVLFSEPKIPQSRRSTSTTQRVCVSVLFSEPKIPQSGASSVHDREIVYRFSALQRAENSSIENEFSKLVVLMKFQCSSASRKFLNPVWEQVRRTLRARFSALQRAENSSMLPGLGDEYLYKNVSVLFSEPKIPQSLAVLKERGR